MISQSDAQYALLFSADSSNRWLGFLLLMAATDKIAISLLMVGLKPTFRVQTATYIDVCKMLLLLN